MPTPSRQDTYSVSVSLNGKSLGVFDKMSGGELDSEVSKYRAGGLAPETVLGGPTTVSDITVSRIYSLDVDHSINLPKLKAAVGSGRVTVTRQPLDADGNRYGRAVVYTGILKKVGLPDVDSQSNDPGMLELEVACDSTVS